MSAARPFEEEPRVLAVTSDDEWRVVRAIAVLLIASVGVSTVLHHGFPAVLDVPSNAGVPHADWLAMMVSDAVTIGLAWLCFRHAVASLGLYRAVLFLAGSFVFTGLEETLWILWGRYDPWLGGTYYFTKGFFWFLETPLTACLGWFFIAYACVYIADILMPNMRIGWRAALAGLLAVNIDLWVDPVQTHETIRAWIWLSRHGASVFSIPVTNFIGWFLLIFLFALCFDRVPAMLQRIGPGRTTVRLFAALMCLEVGILIFFVVVGLATRWVLPQPVNWTIWGI